MKTGVGIKVHVLQKMVENKVEQAFAMAQRVLSPINIPATFNFSPRW